MSTIYPFFLASREGAELERPRLVDVFDPPPMSLSIIDMSLEPYEAFQFFALPFEIRSKILALVLVTPRTYSLDPENYRTGQKRLNVFLTSRQMHEEAYRVFYGSHTFRIFPTHGRFFGDKIVPLTARLPTHYREALVSLELRLGPGWNSPPAAWRVNDRLGLRHMTKVRVLKLFVECDPSLETFRGFRVDKTFYTEFSQELLEGLLQRLPAISSVEIDGWPSVPRHGSLMRTLTRVAKRAGKTVVVFSEIESFERRKEVYKAVAKILPRMNLESPAG